MIRLSALRAAVLGAAFMLAAPLPLPLSAQTQADTTADACGAYQKADATLNAVYKQILEKYKADTAFLGRLRTAQRAWLAYRDAHLESVYPQQDKQAAYGSMYHTCACGVLRELTLQRTAMLQAWLDGAAEGDVCSGSIQVKP